MMSDDGEIFVMTLVMIVVTIMIVVNLTFMIIAIGLGRMGTWSDLGDFGCTGCASQTCRWPDNHHACFPVYFCQLDLCIFKPNMHVLKQSFLIYICTNCCQFPPIIYARLPKNS